METILSSDSLRTAVIGMLCGVLSFSSVFSSPVPAQVTSAITPTTGVGNLGTTVTQAGNTYQITGGTRPGNGTNLFHSFGEFGVPINQIANFLNETALPTSNILGRVTGGNPSNIFGTIQTTGFGSANLFLMNPAGIVFGPNASLNVGGSVSFTTADYLRLADGGRFNAQPGPQDASLSAAPVAAFGFLGSDPGAITVRGGQLAVPEGQSISLVGGNITVQGKAVGEDGMQPVQLSAQGGSINLASVASPGEILDGTLDQGSNFSGRSFASLGTIQIRERAVLDSSGHGGGTIRIRGGSLIVDDSTISANVTGPPLERPDLAGTGIEIRMTEDVVIQNLAVLETNVTDQASPGIGSGGVRIRADHIEIVGVPEIDPETFLFPFTGIRSNVAPMSSGGKSGDISLEGNSITMNRGTLHSHTQGQSNAGSILLTATENISLLNGVHIQSISGSDLPDSAPVSGNAGNIELTSIRGTISMIGDGLNFLIGDVTSETRSNSSGSTGTITLFAPEGDVMQNTADLFTQTRGTGGAGRIDITSRNLMLSNAVISDDNLGPIQPRGITVTLSNDLTMKDHSVLATGSFSQFGASAADLNVTAKHLTITEGSRLTSATFRSGTGGHLTVNADTVQLTDGGQISSGSTRFVILGPQGPLAGPIPTGPGGIITIQANGGSNGSVVVDGLGSGILTNAEGTGAGGNLNLTARSVTIQNGGTISASTTGSAPSATGGNIAISSIQSTNLNSGGSITASSTGPADAGNININAGSQFLSNNGSVTTQASQASGGNITVQATDAIRLVNSRIDTSVQGGPNTAGGNITLDPSVVTLQNSQVRAEAVQGQGGNINIVAGTFLADQTSLVSASSQFGLSGTVNIQSPVSSLSGTLATLPQRPLQVHNLLSQRCAAQATGQLSSLVVAGRDTLPGEPGGWLMSPLAWMPDEAPIQQTDRTGSIGATLQSQAARPGGDQLSDLRQLDVAGCGS